MDRVTGRVTAEAGTVEKHIESYPTQIRKIIEKLRAVAKDSMPGAHEFVYHHAINYKLSESPGTWICYIAAQRNYVNFAFYFGTYLSDPKKLLEGTGKRIRHVKVRTVEEAGADELADLIRQAWTDSPNAVGNLEAKRRQTENDHVGE